MASLVLKDMNNNQECVICANTYTLHKRKKINCGFCPFECCIECIKTYLLTQTALPHCMSCKNQWDDAECDKKLGNFMHTKYRIHRKFMLFEGEKAKIPETMPAVENYLSVNQWKKDAKDLDKQIYDMEMKISNLRRNRNKLIRNIDIVKRGQDPDEENKSEKRKFIRACPQNDCNGFLSSQWKCAVCKIEVCKECHEVKEEGHECDENILATAKALKKDSKPCPGCASLIFKISGCDQMWCTQCHIAFSWNTGKQVNGVVHNPHYYQWARENGGAPIQPGAAGPCGGLPQFHQLIGQIRNYHESYLEFINYGKFFTEFERRSYYNGGVDKWKKFMKEMWVRFPLEMTLTNLIDKVFSQHESVTHFIHHEINRLREACQRQADNKLLRIQYITKEKDEKSMKTTLLRRDNLFKKKNAMLQVYELAGQVFTEAIISTGRNPQASNLYKQIEKCEKLRLYCNEELKKVSKIYKQTVKFIDVNGRANNDRVPQSLLVRGNYDQIKKECNKIKSDNFKLNLAHCLDKLDNKAELRMITRGKFSSILEGNEFYKEWKRVFHRYHRRYGRY